MSELPLAYVRRLDLPPPGVPLDIFPEYLTSAQRVDIGHDVVDRRGAHERVRHHVHLVAVDVLGMGAAHARLEVLELADQVPVAHPREPRRVRAPAALAFVAVTDLAGLEQPAAVLDVARDGRLG